MLDLASLPSSNLQLLNRNYGSVDDKWLKYLKTFLELPASALAFQSMYYVGYLNTAKQLCIQSAQICV